MIDKPTNFKTLMCGIYITVLIVLAFSGCVEGSGMDNVFYQLPSDECMEWGFGEEWWTFFASELPDEWNKRHKEIEEFSGISSLSHIYDTVEKECRRVFYSCVEACITENFNALKMGIVTEDALELNCDSYCKAPPTVVTTATTDDNLDGSWIYINSGTGAGQLRYVKAADTTTKTVNTAFTTTPDSTSHLNSLEKGWGHEKTRRTIIKRTRKSYFSSKQLILF